jgi:hypothetical protein
MSAALGLSFVIACPSPADDAAEGEGEGEQPVCVEDLDCSLGDDCEADADCGATACADVERDENGAPVDGFVCDPADVLRSVCIATTRGGRCGIEADGADRCPSPVDIEDIQTAVEAQTVAGASVRLCDRTLTCSDGECLQ